MRTFLDLGPMPLANGFPSPAEAGSEEARFPLHARVCEACLLVQVEDVVDRTALFSDYAYLSSYSETWVRHTRAFAALACDRLGLGPDSFVLEVASNDGHLLREFASHGVRVLGVEPAGNVAEVARAAGVPTDGRFFDLAVAQELASKEPADLVVANNVLAHVPDLHDFVAGLAAVVKPSGFVTIEFPHLRQLVEHVQFDTIYHEHCSYFSLATARRALGQHGLSVVDVEELATHGGSLRLWACPTGAGRAVSARVSAVLAGEARAGLDRPETYDRFADRAMACRDRFTSFQSEVTARGEVVVGYGAAAKATMFLNFVGATSCEVAYVVDRNPRKQGRAIPGCGIPILAPDRVAATRPDYVLILPWNLRDEVVGQLSHVRSWGGRFVTAVPETVVF